MHLSWQSLSDEQPEQPLLLEPPELGGGGGGTTNLRPSQLERLPSSRSPDNGAGQLSKTQMSVMPVPFLNAFAFTSGAALS